MKHEQGRTINLIGRRLYFMAIQKHWPEVLQSLRIHVAPTYEPAKTIGTASLRELGGAKWTVPLTETWSRFCGDERQQETRANLEHWAKGFSITEEWILEAALHTMCYYHVVRQQRKVPEKEPWYWHPEFPDFGTFVPALHANGWMPPEVGFGGEPWAKFKARMCSQFMRELERYRNETNKSYGAKKINMERDAKWTVLYRKGVPAFEIAIGLLGYDDPEQAVYKQAARFAESIGLNLPKKPRRERLR